MNDFIKALLDEYEKKQIAACHRIEEEPSWRELRKNIRTTLAAHPQVAPDPGLRETERSEILTELMDIRREFRGERWVGIQVAIEVIQTRSAAAALTPAPQLAEVCYCCREGKCDPGCRCYDARPTPEFIDLEQTKKLLNAVNKDRPIKTRTIADIIFTASTPKPTEPSTQTHAGNPDVYPKVGVTRKVVGHVEASTTRATPITGKEYRCARSYEVVIPIMVCPSCKGSVVEMESEKSEI